MRVFVFIWLNFTTFVTGAQNLVPNASFETITGCPENATPGQLDLLDSWKQPGDGTPDVFNTCSKRLCHPKRNFAGSQQPFQGQGYAGFIAYSHHVKTYREYLQVPLSQNLVSGKNYEISLQVSLADFSGYAVSNIGCGFNATAIQSETNFALTPASIVETKEVISDTLHWVNLVFNYTATGTEQYLLIGNFRKFHEIKKIEQVHPGKRAVNNVDAYYYVDDLSVMEKGLAVANVPDKNISTYFTNDSTMVLNNLEFGYDSYTLSEKDKNLLDNIAGYFKQNTRHCLTVEGHTDAHGSFGYNNELSMKRAEAVSEYLSGKGIEQKRLTAVGLGYTRPIDKDIRSARNRRVEIRLEKCTLVTE